MSEMQKKEFNPNHNFSCLYWMKMISAPLNDLEGKTTIFSYYFALFFNWVKIWEVSEVVIFGGVHPSWTSRRLPLLDRFEGIFEKFGWVCSPAYLPGSSLCNSGWPSFPPLLRHSSHCESLRRWNFQMNSMRVKIEYIWVISYHMLNRLLCVWHGQIHILQNYIIIKLYII